MKDKLNGLSRRDFLKFSGAGLAGTALWGVESTWNTARSQQGPVELVFSFGPDDSGSLQTLIDNFNEQYKGRIQVSWQEMARETDTYFRQLESDFIARATDIDVIGGDIIWTAEFAEKGWIQDLSSRFYNAYDPGDFLDAAMNSAIYRYRVRAVPWFTAAGMLYYRKDLLEKSGFGGPPKTWDELREMATKVKQDAGTKYGFVFQGAQYEGGVTNALEYIWGAGGRVLTGNVSVAGAFGMVVVDPNVVVVDNENAARGLNIARSLIVDGVAPEAVTHFREQDAFQAFLAGDAVFMRNWPFVYGLIDNTELSSITQDQVAIAPIPVASEKERSYSCLGGWNLMINAFSRNKDAAWEFIRYASAPEQQKRRAIEGSFLPTLKTLYQDEEVLQEVPVARLGMNAITNSRVRPISPYYSDMSPRIAQAFNQVLEGKLTGEKAVERLQRELQAILQVKR